MTSQRHIPAEILDATRACVLAVGVRRTTLTDVAKRAGVSRMTLYRLVPDVTALILALVTREFGGLIAEAEAEAAALPTARERLVSVVSAVVEQLPRAELFERILDVDPDLLLPYLTERLGATQQLAVDHVRRALLAGRADGSVDVGDVDVLAHCLVLTVGAFVTSSRVIEGACEPAAVHAELRRLVDAWLAAPAVRPVHGGPRADRVEASA